MGRCLLVLPRNAAAGAHGQRTPGAPTDLPLFRWAMATLRAHARPLARGVARICWLMSQLAPPRTRTARCLRPAVLPRLQAVRHIWLTYGLRLRDQSTLRTGAPT